MPIDVLDAVRKMVTTAADDRTPEHQRNSTAIKACELIAKHKLLEGAKPTGITLEGVLDLVDTLSERAETILDTFYRTRAPRRRRYRRRG